MKKLFFVRSGSTCRMLRILAAVMLLLPVNLQPVRASRQDAGAKSSLTVKMKDGRVFSRTQSIHKGHPADMLSREEFQDLFRREASFALSAERTEALIDFIGSLDQVHDMSSFHAHIA